MAVGEVQELTDDLIPILDAFLRKDPLLNAYAIWDLHYMLHRSRFFIVQADQQIQGVLLDFHGHEGFHSIWLRGTSEAIESLLSVPVYDKMLFPFTFPEYEEIIKQKFLISAKYMVDFMLLEKGGEHLHIRHSARLLNEDDAFAFSSLRKKPYEKFSQEEVEQALEIIKEQPVYGIFVNSTLVSAATFHVRLPEIWIIGGLYTRPEYRNLGYATSITSTMVKDALRQTACVGLYVREDNSPAKHVYQKIGFKPHRKIKWLDYNTGLMP